MGKAAHTQGMHHSGAIVIRFPIERVRRPRSWRAGRDLASWAVPLFERIRREERWLLAAVVAAGCVLSIVGIA